MDELFGIVVVAIAVAFPTALIVIALIDLVSRRRRR